MTTEYLTQEGDRWDLLAYKAYGTIGMILLDDGTQVNAISQIINANPDISADDVLPAGTLLEIPIIASITLPTDPLRLPPWKTN